MHERVLGLNADSPVPLTKQEIEMLLARLSEQSSDSPVPLTMEDITDTCAPGARAAHLSAEPSRMTLSKLRQNKMVLLDWDKESRMSAFLRLVADLEALLLPGRLLGSDHEQRVRGSIAWCRRLA